MKQNQKLFIVALTAFSFNTSNVWAETTSAQQGLEKIKSNLENSVANKKEYEKNLEIVNKNVSEIKKAKSTVAKQKESINSEIMNNNESLKKVLVQERDLNMLINQEKEKLAAEAKQLEQLEKLALQIKQNQSEREAVIADYQNQLKLASDEKKSWKDREAELRAQESKTIQSLRSLASEENTWTNKKKGYETETNRWSAEAEKQQKIHETYQGLAHDSK